MRLRRPTPGDGGCDGDGDAVTVEEAEACQADGEAGRPAMETADVCEPCGIQRWSANRPAATTRTATTPAALHCHLAQRRGSFVEPVCLRDLVRSSSAPTIVNYRRRCPHSTRAVSSSGVDDPRSSRPRDYSKPRLLRESPICREGCTGRVSSSQPSDGLVTPCAPHASESTSLPPSARHPAIDRRASRCRRQISH